MSNVKTHFVLNNNYWNCKYCTSKYKYDPSGNTSNRMTHLKGQHPEKMVEKKNEEPETKKARIEFFPQISGNSNVNRSITRFFAQYNIPYSAVDSDSFGELMKCSGKSVKLPNRHELSNIHVPQYAAEIHYEAKVHHNLINEGVPEETKFLALGRPGPNHKFIEAVRIPLPDDADLTFEYDPLWCAVLKNTDHLMKATSEPLFIPPSSGPEKWDFRPSHEQIERVRQLFDNDFTVPENFALTAPPHRLTDKRYDPCLYYLNPQTTEFCNKLQITNFNQLLYLQTEKNNGIPYYQLLERDTDRSAVEEIVAGNIDDEEGINELGDEFLSLVVDSHIESETPQMNPVVASESLEDLIVVEQKT